MNNKIVLLVGVSGCGKSTFVDKYVRENPDTTVISSDKLRGIIGKSEEDQSVTPQVFSIIKVKTEELVKNGKSVLIDATNLIPKNRRDYINIARKYNTPIVAYAFERCRNTLVSNQAKRKSAGGRLVPTDIIDKMLASYVRPTKEEGFSEIHFV